MGIGMTKVLHVKIPVTDLQRSVSWYCSLLELDLSREFVEQGVLRGAALSDPIVAALTAAVTQPRIVFRRSGGVLRGGPATAPVGTRAAFCSKEQEDQLSAVERDGGADETVARIADIPVGHSADNPTAPTVAPLWWTGALRTHAQT